VRRVTPSKLGCASTSHYKFEGKERDAETGNDDFGARYYSNRFGRWLSADCSAPAPVPYANLADPRHSIYKQAVAFGERMLQSAGL